MVFSQYKHHDNNLFKPDSLWCLWQLHINNPPPPPSFQSKMFFSSTQFPLLRGAHSAYWGGGGGQLITATSGPKNRTQHRKIYLMRFTYTKSLGLETNCGIFSSKSGLFFLDIRPPAPKISQEEKLHSPRDVSIAPYQVVVCENTVTHPRTGIRDPQTVFYSWCSPSSAHCSAGSCKGSRRRTWSTNGRLTAVQKKAGYVHIVIFFSFFFPPQIDVKPYPKMNTRQPPHPRLFFLRFSPTRWKQRPWNILHIGPNCP